MRLGHLLVKMAHYTGKGDSGTTTIIGTSGLSKDDVRIEVLGSYDELNAALGVAAAFSESTDAVRMLKSLQDDMHTICAELGRVMDDGPRITGQHTHMVEGLIKECERIAEQRKPFHFVLPGETKAAALLHSARTVSRRAERDLVRLSRTTMINPLLLTYANRLSSLLYIMARVDNKRHNIEEKQPSYKFWDKKEAKAHPQPADCCCIQDNPCGCSPQQ